MAKVQIGRNRYRIDIDIAAGATTVDLAAAVAGKCLAIVGGFIKIEGEIQFTLIEQSGGTWTTVNVMTGETSGVISFREFDRAAFRTLAANKAIQATRSGSAGLSGYLIVEEISN